MYDKRFMSITELCKTGLPRKMLNRLCHAKDAPVIRTSQTANGKYLIDTSKLDDFIRRIG